MTYDGCETEENLSDRVELIFQTTVNGVRWSPSNLQVRPPGSSWVGRAKDLIYLDCESPWQQNLTAGVHTVQMEARLPNDDRVLTSNAVEVTVYCEPNEEEPNGPDFGQPDSGEVDLGQFDMEAVVDGRVAPRQPLAGRGVS